MAPATPLRETHDVIDNLLKKLVDIAELTKLRDNFKPMESKRVEEAFHLLQNEPGSHDSQSARRLRIYHQFLTRVESLSNSSMVALCAAGIGPSAIANMKENDRVRLSSRINELQDQMDSDVLQRLVKDFKSKASSAAGPREVNPPQPQQQQSTLTLSCQLPSFKDLTSKVPTTAAAASHEVSPSQPQHQEGLTGDVYQLTAQDVQQVIESGQVPGEIWLTVTYNSNASPFVTIPISRKLSHRFATQRPRMM